MNLASVHFVDRSTDLDLPFLFEFLEDRTVSANLFDGLENIFLDDSISKLFVGVSALAGILCRFDRRLDLLHERSDVAELDSLDRRLDRATVMMPEDKDHLGAGDSARILKTTEHVVISHVAGNTTDKKVSDTLVKNVLDRDTTIDTRQNDGFGILTLKTRSGLSLEVSFDLLVLYIAGISGLETLDDKIRSQAVLSLFGDDLRYLSGLVDSRSFGLVLRGLVAT